MYLHYILVGGAVRRNLWQEPRSKGPLVAFNESGMEVLVLQSLFGIVLALNLIWKNVLAVNFIGIHCYE